LQVEPVYVIDAEGVSHKVCAYDRCGKPNPRERSPFCSKNHQMRAYNQTEDRRERTKEYNAATRGQWVKRAVCQFCTVEFDDPTYERTTCDDVICKSRALRGEWPYTLLPLALRCTVVPFDHPGRTVQCAASDCTADFQRPNVYTLYCTNACKRRAARSRYAEAWGIDALRARENAKGKRRKARRRLRVFDRDGWTCQLCGGEVDAFADMLDDLAPEADHIIPEAHGGSDDYSNLQCAHRICNREKGDQTGWKSPVRREPNSFVA
jgi:5-methylcytosine-specific restriction endonuclease McrA